ncbi:hypothetical protein BBJ28_00002887 [Nothophytophthora sp. Chile5]|nr:hypothetical protein BBJ28_00002887 [Nothophytophthora sp. Chile5]
MQSTLELAASSLNGRPLLLADSPALPLCLAASCFMTPQPQAHAVTDALPVGHCEECGDDGLFLDRVLLEHFQLHVCITCKQDQSRRDGAFELVPKTRAKAEYALPDSFFRGLAHLEKPNPHHEAFAPLQLFLRRTLLQEAHRLYDGEEGRQQEMARRKKRAFRTAASRTKHLLKRQHLLTLSADTDEEQDADSTEISKKEKKRKEYVPVADGDHRHEFTAESFEEDTAIWTKTCSCGMQVQFEKW